MRLFVRWLMACLVCAAAFAGVWLAGEFWWNWDQAVAAGAGAGAAAIVLAPMAWWAPREPKAACAQAAIQRSEIAVNGNVGGSLVVGANNTLSSITAVASPDRAGIGEGAGSRRLNVIRAYDDAGGQEALGAARAQAFKVGGGYVQMFDFDHLRSFAIWVPLEGGAVVMPESVWEELCAVGDPQREAELPVLAGLPVPSDATTAAIDDKTLSIRLGGGGWKLGTLVRESPHHSWLWRPEPRWDHHASHATRWERDTAFDVRCRAIMDMAWLGRPYLRSIEDRRAALLAAAAAGSFSNVFDVLGACYGVKLGAPIWGIAKGSHNNWANGIHITALLTDADGKAAVRADVMLQVPGESYEHSLLGCIDVHLNMRAFTHMLRAAGAVETSTKLSLGTVLKLLDVEIENAAEIVPTLVIDDPDHVRYAMPPFVVTKVQTGRVGTDDPPRSLELADVVDLTPLGEPSHSLGYQETGIRIVGARNQDPAQRRAFLIDAFVSHAIGWGFANARRDALADALDH